MATLLSVHNSEGCVGRCDARCYEARHRRCDCVCSGANHGAGLQKAQANMTAFAENWIERWQALHPDQRVERHDQQPPLFL